MVAKLLLDENLSPVAAVALIAEGIDACHVRDRGLLGASDHDLLERAYQEDRVLVTSIVDDFGEAAVAGHGPMINEVLHVGEDGSMIFEPSPA